MPSPERDHPQAVGPAAVEPVPLDRGRARTVAVLTSPELAAVVDLVAWVAGGWLHVANAGGAARVPRDRPDQPWQVLSGRSPVADQDPLHGTPLAAALADPSPANGRNAYPFAGPRLASAFDDPDRAPDVVVVHAAARHWPERGGHRGEHGSLDAGQSRAPLLLSGPGVRARGILPAAARVVDVAPTLAALAGADMPGVDGRVLDELVDVGAARRVLGLLWDGANSNDVLDLAVRGELPAVARLLADGCALSGGAVAEFPSVTLVNHTSALTGLRPGRHGIVHNVFLERSTGRRVLANDSSTWHHACDLLRPGVSTVFEAVARARPSARTACVNEPVDRGATYSTFGLVRATGEQRGAGSLGSRLPPAAQDPHATQRWVAADPDYAWSTQVDGLGLAQVLQLFADPSDLPVLTWWNSTLTDTGHHGGGPYSEEARASLRDADRRLGVVLDLLAEQGTLADTAVLLTADHGSEGADPACTGDWDTALAAAGIPFRDEGYGFLYLG